MDSRYLLALPGLVRGLSVSGTIAGFLSEVLRSQPNTSTADLTGARVAGVDDFGSPAGTVDQSQVRQAASQRVSLFTAYCLWKQIGERSGRSDVGMMVARQLTPEKAGLAGRLFKESRTLRDAVQIMARFPGLAISCIDIKLEERRTEALFQFMVRPALLPYSITECYLFICIYWWSHFVGRDRLPIKELSLVYPEPPHVELYRQAMHGARLRFGQRTNIIRLDREVFDSVNPGFSGYLRNLLIRHAEELVKTVLEKDGLSPLVLQRIKQNMPDEPLSIESLARKLDMSERTMRRRLREESFSYRELLELARREISCSMLRDPQLQMEDIAFLLGYSDYSTFSRAFKKWFGVSPSHYHS